MRTSLQCTLKQLLLWIVAIKINRHEVSCIERDHRLYLFFLTVSIKHKLCFQVTKINPMRSLVLRFSPCCKHSVFSISISWSCALIVDLREIVLDLIKCCEGNLNQEKTFAVSLASFHGYGFSTVFAVALIWDFQPMMIRRPMASLKRPIPVP